MRLVRQDIKKIHKIYLFLEAPFHANSAGRFSVIGRSSDFNSKGHGGLEDLVHSPGNK